MGIYIVLIIDVLLSNILCIGNIVNIKKFGDRYSVLNGDHYRVQLYMNNVCSYLIVACVCRHICIVYV